MSKPNDAIACPACGTELSLEHLMSSVDDEQAFSRLVALSVPMAHLVVLYIGLFTPEKQRLTLRKKVRLIAQLLPDLRRQAITHKGREWATPHDTWAKAIEQMLTARAAGRLDLPMTGHGYLYAILAGMADKVEAVAERAQEVELRTGSARLDMNTLRVNGRFLSVEEALQTTTATKTPALAAMDAHEKHVAPVPPQARELLAKLKGQKP